MVITSYKCDYCGKEYKENKENCYIIGFYAKDGAFKVKDMCDECRGKLLKFVVEDLCK